MSYWEGPVFLILYVHFKPNQGCLSLNLGCSTSDQRQLSFLHYVCAFGSPYWLMNGTIGSKNTCCLSSLFEPPHSWHCTKTYSNSGFTPGYKVKHRPDLVYVITLIYIDIQLNRQKNNRRIALWFSGSPLWCLQLLQDKLQMIVDIKWIVAGGCGFEVLFPI